jgi:oxygen-dependent protoporphyrinogen oxidase
VSGEVLDRVVVGAGITGLCAAWRSRRAGRSVVLLEAAPRVGGVIRTERVGPYRVERAAGSFPSTAVHLLEVHASLPAPPAIHTPAPGTTGQYLLTRHGIEALPRGPGKFARSRLLSTAGKVRALAEPLLGPRRVKTPETAWQFVRRRFGREVADHLLKPMTLGIYGTRPEDLGLADAFPTLPTIERESGSLVRALVKRRGGTPRALLAFRDGMESFPRAIAEALGDAVRLSTPVTALDRDGDALRVSCGDGTTLLAREVVLATTAGEQARLVAPLSPVAADPLAAVAYVPMVVVSVGVPPGASPAIPPMFGFLRTPRSGARILGASVPSSLNPDVAPSGHALLTVFVGGGGDPDAIHLSDDEVRGVVERDLARALGGPVRPDMVSLHRWPRAIPVLSPGHRARMAAAEALVAPLGIRLSGSHVTGVGVHACCAPLSGDGSR